MEREYKMDAVTRRCHECERVFAVGEEYFSAVAETAEEDRLQRQEFCPECWDPAGGAYFSFWRIRVPEPLASHDRGPRLVDLGRLMQLFEHLAGVDDVPAQRFRYVLALVLMRKRRLKVLESRRLGGGRGEELTLREPGTDRRHVVSCPSITEDEIRSVADRLREILDMPEKWDQMATADAEAQAAAAATAPEAEAAPEAEPDAGASGHTLGEADSDRAADDRADREKDGAADA